MEYYDNWREEKRSAYLYGIVAQHESAPIRKKLFFDLQIAAEKQAGMWENKMKQLNIPLPKPFTPCLRSKITVLLIKFIGTEHLPSLLSAMKIRGMSTINQYQHEHQHTSFSAASNLRAAVFGINDGLISNVSLILGMAAANADHHIILTAGIAGLLAGACSMGAGEYVSVRSQREIFEYQIAIEKQELEEYPEEEIEELDLIYQARGIPPVEARKLAELMIKNPETGLNTLAREELGINPESLVSPIGALFSSFFSFAIGAAIPLIPFLLPLKEMSLSISLGLTALALFLVGCTMSLFTNQHPLIPGIRMLLIGGIAGLITFSIGKLLGVALY